MKNKMVYVLCGIGIVQVLGWGLMAGKWRYGALLAAGGTMLFAVYMAAFFLNSTRKKKCPECHSIILKSNRICPECGFCFAKGISSEELTEYIEKEKEKTRTSEQIDCDFEKIEAIALEEVTAYDGDIEEFLQERCSDTETKNKI